MSVNSNGVNTCVDTIDESMANEDNDSQSWDQMLDEMDDNDMIEELKLFSEKISKRDKTAVTSSCGESSVTVITAAPSVSGHTSGQTVDSISGSDVQQIDRDLATNDVQTVVTDGYYRGSDGSPVPTRPALIRLAFARTPTPTAPHSSVGHTSSQSLDSICGSDVQQIDQDLATSDVQSVIIDHMTPEPHITTQSANHLDSCVESTGHQMRTQKRPNVSIERTVGSQNRKPTQFVANYERIQTRSVTKRMRLETISQSIDESNGRRDVDTNGSVVLSATPASVFLKRITQCPQKYPTFESLNESNGLKVDALSVKPFNDCRQVFESSGGETSETDSTSAATVGGHPSDDSYDILTIGYSDIIEEWDKFLATVGNYKVTANHVTPDSYVTTQATNDLDD